jgi:predicted nucleic acid-binding protein
MTQGKEMAAKKSVYIESTIPSYATAQPSSNVLNLVRKTQTETFWNTRDAYMLWISQDVLEEIGRGDPQAARRRLDFVKDIALLPEPDGLDRLSSVYQEALGIPERTKTDCYHLAYCVLSRIDYLLTWNCAHLGPIAQGKIRVYNDRHGLWTPFLVTPEVLYGIQREEHA